MVRLSFQALKKVIVMRILSIFLAGVFSLIMSASAQSDTLVLETSKGEIRIAMLSTIAPNHVTRIKELVDEGYYDGIIFHRVIPGFMAQTGDPTGTGMGGSGQKLDAEFSDYQYQSGTVGMARTMDPNSADSQFFICFDGCGHLTGQYTVWGQVGEGMEVVEAINAGEPPADPDQIIRAYMAE
jgi:peptidylprolyl isomerase